MQMVSFVSAHTGNPATENIITIYDWIIGIPLIIIFVVVFILLIKYLIKKWKRKKESVKRARTSSRKIRRVKWKNIVYIELI